MYLLLFTTTPGVFKNSRKDSQAEGEDHHFFVIFLGAGKRTSSDSFEKFSQPVWRKGIQTPQVKVKVTMEVSLFPFFEYFFFPFSFSLSLATRKAIKLTIRFF